MKADIKHGSEESLKDVNTMIINRFIGSIPTDKEELSGCQLSSDVLAAAVNRMINYGKVLKQ